MTSSSSSSPGAITAAITTAAAAITVTTALATDSASTTSVAEPAPTAAVAAAIIPLAISLAAVVLLLVVVVAGLVVAQHLRRRLHGRDKIAYGSGRDSKDGLCVGPSATPALRCADCGSCRQVDVYLCKGPDFPDGPVTKGEVVPRRMMALPCSPAEDDLAVARTDAEDETSKFATLRTRVQPAPTASTTMSTPLADNTPPRSIKRESVTGSGNIPRASPACQPSPAVNRRPHKWHQPGNCTASARNRLPDIPDDPDSCGVSADQYRWSGVSDAEHGSPGLGHSTRCSYVSVGESVASSSEAAESMYAIIPTGIHGGCNEHVQIIELPEGDSAASPSLTIKGKSAAEIGRSSEIVDQGLNVMLDDSTASRLKDADVMPGPPSQSASLGHSRVTDDLSSVILETDSPAISPAVMVRNRSIGEAVCCGAAATTEYVSTNELTACRAVAAEYVYAAVLHTASSQFSGLHDHHVHTTELVKSTIATAPAMKIKDRTVGEVVTVGYIFSQCGDATSMTVNEHASHSVGGAGLHGSGRASHQPPPLDGKPRPGAVANHGTEGLASAEQASDVNAFAVHDKPGYENAHAFRQNMRRRE